MPISRRSKLTAPDLERRARSPCPDGLLGVLRHQDFELALGFLMLKESWPGSPEACGQVRPGVRHAHVHHPDRLDPWPRRFQAEQVRGLASFDAAPELLFRRQQQVLVERVGRDGDLDPFAAAGDDRQRRTPRRCHPHVMLQLRHVLGHSGLFRERPGQHELGLKHRAGSLHHAVQGCRHPPLYGMENLPLHLGHGLAGIAFVPAPVEVFGDRAELDDQVAGQVLRLDLAALLAPQAEQGGFVVAHDDPGVGAAKKGATIQDLLPLAVLSNIAPSIASCNLCVVTDPAFGSSPVTKRLYSVQKIGRYGYNVNSNRYNVPMKAIQLRMARAAVGWGVRELAGKAGVTANTVTRIENGSDAKQSTLDRLKSALEAAGVEFIDENGGGPGVRLRKATKEKSRKERG